MRSMLLLRARFGPQPEHTWMVRSALPDPASGASHQVIDAHQICLSVPAQYGSRSGRFWILPAAERGISAHEVDGLGPLVPGELLPAEGDQPAARSSDGLDAVDRLDDRLDLLAELVVGDADHRHVGHRQGARQDGLDLGRVDVDAAGDDHVDLAVRQPEVAVLVEVADVAGGEHAGPRWAAGGLLRVVVVLEVRPHRVAEVERPRPRPAPAARRRRPRAPPRWRAACRRCRPWPATPRT